MRTYKILFCSLRRDRRLIQTKWTLAVINILRPYQIADYTTRVIWRFTDALRFGVTVCRYRRSPTLGVVNMVSKFVDNTWHSTKLDIGRKLRFSACSCQLYEFFSVKFRRDRLDWSVEYKNLPIYRKWYKIGPRETYAIFQIVQFSMTLNYAITCKSEWP